jgi:hypothetical protein
MNGVYGDEEYPENEAEDPRIGGIPKIQYQLGSNEVGGDRDGVIEPIVPREGESVSWGKKSGSIGIERSYVPMEQVSVRTRMLSRNRIGG